MVKNLSRFAMRWFLGGIDHVEFDAYGPNIDF